MRRQILSILALVVLIIAVYAQVRNYGFINLDDHQYVTKNQYITHGFSLPAVVWALTAVYEATWQPLVWFSYLLDIAVAGLNPGIFHITNVILHILNTLLLLSILNRLTGSFWKSYFVAALFALHPLHVESVVWIAERKGLLSTFFLFLGLWAYLFYRKQPSFLRYFLIFTAFILGLMAKPMLVTFPFMLLLIDYWPLERFKIVNDKRFFSSKVIWEKIPFFAIAVASSLIAVFTQKKGGALQSFEDYHLGIRSVNAIVSYVRYLAKMFWPTDLAIYYPHPGLDISIPLVVASGIFLLCVSWLILHFRRWYPYLAMGWAWYLVTLLPVIGLVQIGGHAMADRFTYIPLIGIFIMLAWGCPDFLQRFPSFSKMSPFLAVPILSICAFLSYVQVGYWETNATVFAHAVDATPNNAPATLFLGNSLVEDGYPEVGIPFILKAIQLNPESRHAYACLGYAYERVGKLDKSSALYTELLKLDPQNASYHHSFADVLLKQKKYDQAILHYRHALRLEPNNQSSRAQMAAIFFVKGDYPAAWKEVHLARKAGVTILENFLRDLSAKMPEPKE